MRLSLRLVVSLVLGITLVSTLFTYYEYREEKGRREAELEKRAADIGESLQQAVQPALANGQRRVITRIVEKFSNRESLAGLAVYDTQGVPLAITPQLQDRFVAEPEILKTAVANSKVIGQFAQMQDVTLHLYALPLHDEDGRPLGGIVIVHDATFIESELKDMLRNTFLHALVQMLTVSLITLIIVRLSIQGPVTRAAQWMKALRTGRLTPHAAIPDFDLFPPLAYEVENFANSLQAARASASAEARLRLMAESSWTAERLAVFVKEKLQGSRLFVISNREPYIHQKNGDKGPKVVVPASGLVTALEPILCACDGTWIAHGSGDADRSVVDSHSRLRVPPTEPKYTLRRVWLTKEEEDGYYYGFANEGLWPLCHIAHTRPLFRIQDWEHYRSANQKFADALIDEMSFTVSPVVLLQDYHFALLPRMIKRARPDAKVAIFWHIPWPNPEAFSICPWQTELLDGMLGADLIGFHIQSHCNNFLESVDRTLESRIEWDHFTVKRENHITAVHPYPISVVFPEVPPSSLVEKNVTMAKAALRKQLGIDPLFLGVGVDRVDYTKGILERFLAVEKLLESQPAYIGQFTFVQIGSPSRTQIKRYHDLLEETSLEAERINKRFQAGSWRPIVFLKHQHSHQEIQPFYKAADLCMVTSLHDGMNLVAKEFVAARDDEHGVLVLSQFTGASRELQDAVIVNPYDIGQIAKSIHLALTMDNAEQQARMRRMRKTLKEQNVYRWAGNLITDLCEVRLDANGAIHALENKDQDFAQAS